MRLALLILLMLPAVAHADPASVFGALGKLLAHKIVGALTVGQIAFTVALGAIGAAQKRRLERKAVRAAREAHNSRLQDRTITAVSTDAPLRYVIGRARVGSDVVAIFETGDKDQYKHLVCVHAAHECDGLEQVYIAGKALGPLDSNGAPTSGDYLRVSTESRHESHGTANFSLEAMPNDGSVMVIGWVDEGEGPYSRTVRFTQNPADKREITVNSQDAVGVTSYTVSYTTTVRTPMVWVRTHLGAGPNNVSAYLRSILPDKWTVDHKLDHLTFSLVTLDLNQPEFQGGIPPIEVLLRGRKLYDYRTGTTAWSQNSALALYWYLTSELCEVDADDLPMARWIAAANVCDQDVPGLGKRYTANGAIFADQTQAEVIEQLCGAMAGDIEPNTWNVYAGDYTAPVLALEQSDIVGKLVVTPGPGEAEIFNTVRGQFISSENAYVATDYQQYQNATYLATDADELVLSSQDFPFTDSTQRVHNLARILTEDNREGFTIQAEFSLKAWPAKFGDRVSFDSTFLGHSSKVFRVIRRKFKPGGVIELTLKEDAPSIWDFADAVSPDAIPNTNLPNPFRADPPASLACKSGTSELLVAADGTIISRIRVSWPLVQNGAIQTRGAIEVEWQPLGGSSWQRISVTGDQTETFASPVQDGEWYLVRARCVYPYLNVRSDWVYATPHQVIGKTEPPPNIAELSISGSTLSWSPVEALDLRGYVFRFHYGNNRDWGTAAPLHEGILTSSPFELSARPGGVATIMGKAVDTSGNQSRSAATVVLNLGDPPIANVVEVFDFHADGFPGTVAGGTIDVDGDLIADENDSAYGSDNQSFYGPDNEPAFGLSSFDELVYTTGNIHITSALAGSVMTIEHEIGGIDLVIHYRLAGPGPAYGADADSAYGPDDDPFYGAPGPWIPWPGQIVADNDIYQFRVTVGAGPTRGRISALRVIVDAPDIVEYIEDVPIDAGGTVVPYTKSFTSIKTITATLQANASGAETVEVDKTNNLAPVIRAYDASHNAVSGATADIIVKGY